ncbi:MAG: uracil phosphoribosyltransferase [Gammaproteobacteria bacterium]|jgi:uracil phosphoribosyltransferase|nr:uracil phosphoribosyltransferase [Gammaproteobacteria bacterium]
MSIYCPPEFPNFRLVCHPLLSHKLTQLRDVKTPKKEFNELVREITQLLVYEATKDLPMEMIKIQTPLEVMESPALAGKKPVILPILRAGIGMVDGFLANIPSARVGHIGLFRNEETLQPQLYYFKIPKQSEDRQFYICDPMLATGGSAIATIKKLKEAGVSRITFVCLVAAPEGVKKLLEAYPDVPIFSASLDRQLSDHGYILPGLGDAGDRLFGTK